MEEFHLSSIQKVEEILASVSLTFDIKIRACQKKNSSCRTNCDFLYAFSKQIVKLCLCDSAPDDETVFFPPPKKPQDFFKRLSAQDGSLGQRTKAKQSIEVNHDLKGGQPSFQKA